jgi:hypothetical protein
MANVPVNKDLYARVKAEAKRKFKSWPSAYGSAWLVKTYKQRGGKYRTASKEFGGMSDAALNSMQSFYKDMQKGKYNPTLMQNSLNDLNSLQAINPRQTYLKNIKSGTGETLYKGPGLFSKDPYVLDKNINIQTQFGPRGKRIYKNMYELDQPGFSTTNNLGYSDDVPEGTRYMMDASGNDYSVRPQMKTGGIPERYKNMGFTKAGVKRQSTRPGKKWMVLAKKGNKYKVVHGGDNKMQDFKQHGSADRKKRFWDRMGGRDSAKAQDPFSPLYWHKKFGTWQEGGQFIYDANNPMPQFEMGNSILDKMKRENMRKGGQPCYECGGMYAAGGTNNPGFRALPPDVQQMIRANMNSGGMTPFNADPNYYGERLEKFIGNIRNTAAENLFPDMQEEVMAMPQARYGMPIYQNAGGVNDSGNLINAPTYIYDAQGNLVNRNTLTYGNAVFDQFGNLLGGYDRNGKMYARRPGKTYTIPNSDETVTIGNDNNLIYDTVNPSATQSVPGTGQQDITTQIRNALSQVNPDNIPDWAMQSLSPEQRAQITATMNSGRSANSSQAAPENASTNNATNNANNVPAVVSPAPVVQNTNSAPTVTNNTAATTVTAENTTNGVTIPETVDDDIENYVIIDEDGEYMDEEVETIDNDDDLEEDLINDVPPIYPNYDALTPEQKEAIYNLGNQGMYTDQVTGMLQNVPQNLFNQQSIPGTAQTGIYPQYYGNPYLQSAQYKYGPLGRNLRRVDLQYGIPGQQQGMVPPNFAAGANNVTPEALIAGMTGSGMMSPQTGRRAQRQALREKRQASRNNLSNMRQDRRADRFENRMERRSDRIDDRFDRGADRINDRFDRRSGRIPNMNAETPFVNQSTTAEPTSGAIRGIDRNILQTQMEAKGVKYNNTEGQRFEGYDLIALPDGQFEYRPKQMYGGTNPYMEMYKQGGEYYMDEDTINMILAMGGDIEFLD